MDGSSLIVVVTPITTLITLFTGHSLAFHRCQPDRPEGPAAETRR
jgi:hypothetical protein